MIKCLLFKISTTRALSHKLTAAKLFVYVKIQIFSIWTRQSQIETFFLHFLTLYLSKKGITNDAYVAPVEFEFTSSQNICQDVSILFLCRNLL